MPTITIGNPNDYAVLGDPATSGFNKTCCPCDEVMHVTHRFRIPEILRSKQLTGRLVYDDSNLNTTRRHVVWVSPNYWHKGFRYGNVGFQFDWPTLLQGRHAYWIEVAHYSPPACRILLTTSPQAHLTSYDPTLRTGPWWHDLKTGKHYYNSKYVLEFMIEGDLPLTDVVTTSTVDHSSEYCSEYRNSPASCSDFGSLGQVAASLLVATIVGDGTDPAPLRLRTEVVVRGAWWHLRGELAPGPLGGTIKATDPSAAAVARGALALYGSGQAREGAQLAAMFASKDDARESLRQVIEKTFAIAPGYLEDPKPRTYPF